MYDNIKNSAEHAIETNGVSALKGGKRLLGKVARFATNTAQTAKDRVSSDVTPEARQAAEGLRTARTQLGDAATNVRGYVGDLEKVYGGQLGFKTLQAPGIDDLYKTPEHQTGVIAAKAQQLHHTAVGAAALALAESTKYPLGTAPDRKFTSVAAPGEALFHQANHALGLGQTSINQYALRI